MNRSFLFIFSLCCLIIPATNNACYNSWFSATNTNNDQKNEQAKSVAAKKYAAQFAGKNFPAQHQQIIVAAVAQSTLRKQENQQ